MSIDPDRDAPLEGALWELVRATSIHSGAPFFRELTKHLALALDVRVALIGELLDERRMRPLSLWIEDDWVDEPVHDLTGTPCAQVLETRSVVRVPGDVASRFPDDERLRRWGIESYAGTPLIGSGNRVMGLLCVMDHDTLDERRTATILDTFASRAALELDRIHTLRELDEQRAFLRQVLDVNPSLIFAKDRDGRFTLANKAIAEVYGTTVDNLTGKTDADFNPNEDEVAFFRQMDLEVMDTLQDRFIPEEPLTDARGHLRWVQTIKRAIVDENGRSDQVLGVATDITEFKRTREELLERQRREKEKVQAELDKVKQELVRQARLAAIGQVAASIAHELRNPLGAINNSIFFLSRHFPDLDAKWERHLDIMRQEVMASDRIVTNLLEMSRAKEPARELTDLGLAIRESFARAAGSSSVRLELRLEVDPFEIRADRQQMRQVFNNVMMNAVQSLQGNGTIDVEARHEGDESVIRVQDDGVGIPAAIREDVFEPLFTTKTKGTGLGLAICRQILERHRGSIRVLPSERGALLEIRLPTDGRAK